MNLHCQKWVRWSVVLIAGLIMGREAFASGYRPSFSQALKEADLVVQGEVVEAWNALGGAEPDRFSKERAYRMVVKKSFKGALKPGDEIYFWDPHFRSTASYWVNSDGTYICYLVPAKLSDFETQQIVPKGKRFYRPIRVRHKASAVADPVSSRKDYFAAELTLLDLFVENVPENKRAAYRELLENKTDPQVLYYVVRGWPEPLIAQDIQLFRQHMQDAVDPAASYIRHMGYALNDAHATWSDVQIFNQLSKGGPNSLSMFRAQINESNIELLQSLLFKWVIELDAGGVFPEVVRTLAEYAPDFLRTKLREYVLPEWKQIAALKALGTNGHAIGKADYPEEILNIHPSTLRSMLRLREGDLFHARLALTSPARHEDWKTALPLLEPMLSETNSSSRRLCVALFRTFGVPVERAGSVYSARYTDAPALCPVELSLSMERNTFRIGEEIRFKLTETGGVSGPDFCFQGTPVATLHFVDNWLSPQSVPGAVWKNVVLPLDAYTKLSKDSLNEEELVVFRTIDRPGTYRITFAKCYTHDGGEHGLDAWTGMAFAENELVFFVEEP